MISRVKVFYLVSLFFIAEFMPLSTYADELVDPPISETKHNLSVCALFKNEANYLKEWIEYHKMVGVDHFYLYNNGSIDRSVEILIPYIKEGLVTLVQWPNRLPKHQIDNSMWALSTQLPAYENAAKYLALKDTKWLVVLEVDEFIVPVNAKTISEILEGYDEYPGLQVVSDFFNTSLENKLPKRNLIIESIELTSAPDQKIENSVEKTIFKPEYYTSFYWPPYRCNFKDNKHAAKLAKGELRINKYVNRSKGGWQFGKIKEKLHVDNRMITDEEAHTLLECGYEIEDQERAIYRFVPGLLKRMELDTGWNW